MGRRVLTACVLALLPVGLLAYGLRSNPGPVPSPLLGGPAPAFSLPRLDGGEIRLDELRGRVVVLNFWASWCAPCRQEAPALETVWRRYRDAGLVVIGVNIQDREAAARNFLVQTRSSFPTVVDATGAASIAYGIYGVPETFVIDRRGLIRARQVGAISPEALADHIRHAVENGS